MYVDQFLDRLKHEPESVTFDDAIEVIDSNYAFTPTAFINGDCHNGVGQNNGSCKILAFGRLHDLTPAETLSCFGDYYRRNVLAHPDGNDHQNIRQFIIHGWDGVRFEGEVLKPKSIQRV